MDPQILEQLSARDSIKALHNPRNFVTALKKLFDSFKKTSIYAEFNDDSFQESPPLNSLDVVEMDDVFPEARSDPSKHFSELFEQIELEFNDLGHDKLSTIEESSPYKQVTRKLMGSQSDINIRPRTLPGRKLSTPIRTDLIFAGELLIYGTNQAVWVTLTGTCFTILDSYQNQIILMDIPIDTTVQAIPKSNPIGFAVFSKAEPLLELLAPNVVMSLKWCSYITAVSCNFSISK